MKPILQFIKEWVLPISLALALSLLFRAHVAEAMYIPSGSMEPTLQVNDIVVIKKLDKDIERGDIVVFLTPKMYNGKEHLIKRVVGLPGETVTIEEGNLYINGQVLSEPYLKDSLQEGFGNTVVPQNSYFLMGDNRNNSMDSRSIGAIPEDQIKGKFVFKIPFSYITKFKSDNFGG